MSIRQYRNNATFSFSLIVIKMQPRDVASCGDTAVAGLISEQSECNAFPPTAVIHVFLMTAVPRNVHLLDSRGRLNAGD